MQLNGKKRFSIILLFSLLSVALSAEGTKRALLIGIGTYPVESGWNQINGDKDIPYVRKMLMSNGFNKQHITSLKNEQATYSAICSAMETLVSESEINDFVYIHFSGHGQMTTDLSGDEEDGFDEAWIPYDAQKMYASGKYEGEHHLIDDRINGWLHRIRQKVGESGKIIVVADACHSGESTRGEANSAIMRGTKDAFSMPAAILSVKTKPALYPVEWIAISACKSYQSNYEYNGMGSLTYALYKEYQDFNKLTNAQLQQKIRENIRNINGKQTPVVEIPEGEKEELFFRK